MHITEKDQVRFWAKVSLPDSNGCMLWIDKPNKRGYGRLQLRQRNVRAHRVSLWLAAGDPPAGKPEAAHSCRSKTCVAPAHLSWKSRKGNSDDRKRDGTLPCGERNANAKLTAVQVKDIRSRYAQGGISQKDLGQQYGVAQTTVSEVVLGKKWTEV